MDYEDQCGSGNAGSDSAPWCSKYDSDRLGAGPTPRSDGLGAPTTAPVCCCSAHQVQGMKVRALLNGGSRVG